METFTNDQHCFVCGKDNPAGLKLEFISTPDTTVASVVFHAEFQGWQGVVHGGLLSTVLDEVMVKAAEHAGYPCVTAELSIRFHRPAPTEEKLTVTGSVAEVRRRIICCNGTVTDQKGTLLCSGNAKLYAVAADEDNNL